MSKNRRIFFSHFGVEQSNEQINCGVNLVLGAVNHAEKLSLVVEYTEETVETRTMEKIKDQAMEFLF